MKFTDSKVKSLKSKKDRYIQWEDGHTGMGLRVAPSGRKSFIFMYRYEGKSRMMTIGPYTRISLASARVKVADAKAKLEKHIDPGVELLNAKAKARRAPTVADLAEEYLEKWARPRKRSASEDERILNKDVIPEWGRRKAADIRRRDVIILLDEILDRGSPIIANRTLAVIRKMYNFGMGRDIVGATPCSAIQMPSKENRRDRVLSDKEIKAFWNGLEPKKVKMSDGSKLALKLQLISAQRKGEVVTAEWSDIDLENKMWTIPKEKSKNELAHRVPLSDLAMDIIDQIKFASGNSAWLFPSGKNDTHVGPTSIDHSLRKSLDMFKIDEKFVPHDLRRTAASQMASAGVPRLVISKILNHAESGITAVYDRHSYDNEKRMALDTWSRKLESIITGKKGKVIPLIKGSQ